VGFSVTHRAERSAIFPGVHPAVTAQQRMITFFYRTLSNIALHVPDADF